MKRVFDVFFSLSLLIFLFPIFIVVIYFVRKDSGPAFFVQERVGLGGRSFQIYKFRSMVVNSEKNGSHMTQKNDARITHVGRFLRKTSIDELPQLLNVLKGDMSIVGPRPNVPAQKSDYTHDQWDKRNSVLPGITGLAQSTLRSTATFEERLKLDMSYIDNANLCLDIKILFLTIKQVVFKGGY